MAGAARIASIAGSGDGGALRRPRCQIRHLFALYSGDLHLQIRPFSFTQMVTHVILTSVN
uniref:Uncharacterized protein n=1 Tax=Oryza nivara TaxID=4536 RepID=A0A0E0IEE5_ORYNI